MATSGDTLLTAQMRSSRLRYEEVTPSTPAHHLAKHCSIGVLICPRRKQPASETALSRYCSTKHFYAAASAVDRVFLERERVGFETLNH